MRAKTGLLALFVGACAFSVGCRTTLEGSAWLPDFTSTQQSGGGGTPLDLDTDLHIDPDDQVFVFDLIGDAGRNRVRVDYWTIHGEGFSAAGRPADINFANDTHLFGEDIDSVVDLTSIGILWEPALIKTDGFRFRAAVGLDLLKFRMDLTSSTVGTSTAEMPDPDGPLGDIGMDYMPVPKVGLAFEADLSDWVRLHGRAQMFDASYLELDDRFDGTFLNAVFGVAFGKHRGIRGFLGYRIFNAEYQFEDDSGDASLEGFVASVSARF